MGVAYVLGGFCVFVYVLARTTVALQDYAAKRGVELERWYEGEEPWV